ncbi:MAG: ATP-binding cassette domain-containing protein, partial [Defluviitaleaceae bacterium]|nr:ATP-binding cassette domain-containing protein [Defluviitaleaceae bacterium]
TINTTLTLVFFGAFPVLIALQVLVSLPIQKKSAKIQETAASFNAVVNDSLQNVSTVAAYGLENALEERYLNEYEGQVSALRSFMKALLPLTMFGILASILPDIIVSIFAAVNVINGTMYIGEYIAFVAAAAIASSWLMMLSQTLGALQHFAAGAKRFNENTAEELEILEDASLFVAQADKTVDIRFENVAFSYGEGEDAVEVLSGISFEITHGDKVAFKGESGSGKSTILKLLMGLYEPSGGKIYINNVDAATIPKNTLRQLFSYVPQDNFMFPEGIGTNIAGGVACEQTLRDACQKAGILSFIESLPQGFDTVLVEDGENVSGGQRQRLALARAFYKNAPVILFDEATSALDPATEAAILTTLEEYAKDKTIIMVAHREAAAQSCDTIIQLAKGRVI